ncbi:MAG: M28 family peptidase, partial [Candidatus Zixiibacteriota bacterium]
MSKLIFCSLFAIFLTCMTVNGTDFYLLKINDEFSAGIAKSIVPNAHGMVDNKFIVSLSPDQEQRLKAANVSLELLSKDCNIDRTYMLEGRHSRRSRTALELNPIYSTDNMYIIEMPEDSKDILIREGYMVFRLADMETPIFYSPVIYANPPFDDYPGDTLADLVIQDSLYSYDARLEAFYTRFTPTDSCVAARSWLFNKFLSFGYSNVRLHAFQANNENQNVYNAPAWNVVCKKIGTEKPDTWIIIGGHYDSYIFECNDNPLANASGADDDATGTATTLELARIFKNYPSRKSFMFVPFGAEEQFLIGSDSLAFKLYQDSVHVEFVLNTDMIAYFEGGEPTVQAMTSGIPYYEVFLAAAERLTDLIPLRGPIAAWDARPFVNYGACGITLHEKLTNPFVHTSGDIITALDFEYMTKVVRTAAATLAVIDASVDPVVCEL